MDGSTFRDHLYKHHQQKPNCPRCRRLFDNEADLSDHAQLEVSCIPARHAVIEGFDKSQLERLKCRKRPRDPLSEEDKWKNIYRILFPHCTVTPDPFYRIQLEHRPVEHSDIDRIFAHEDNSSHGEQLFHELEKVIGVPFNAVRRRKVLALLKTYTQNKLGGLKENQLHLESADATSERTTQSLVLDKDFQPSKVEDLTESLAQGKPADPLRPEGGDGAEDVSAIEILPATLGVLNHNNPTQTLYFDQYSWAEPLQAVECDWDDGAIDGLFDIPSSGHLNVATAYLGNATARGGEYPVCVGLGKLATSNRSTNEPMRYDMEGDGSNKNVQIGNDAGEANVFGTLDF
ncbi:uncharacterized protein CLUP02_09100 [Colletotrichum lupini]|uniref:C2H2-type domain-containing protein n=1 Tax=Colletotrichum lupini TaxID=145971 RepID=A0A9Q8SVL0_9PEZI|nr:uncharacterized protein CLUP02_09100 [Colletotrichum lupini]UQC83606.1 hypothetical protein CLUP02_09100 [Colletotrichum lupini]